MAGNGKSTREATPPYVSFATVKNFIDRLREIGLPNRIDRSVMANLSGGVQSQLDAALRYLGFVDAHRAPTEHMEGLMLSDDEERRYAFQEVLKNAYPFIFQDGMNLETATAQEIHERFVKAGASGDTVRKCISFFLGAAKEAGFAISPHIEKSKSFSPAKKGPKARRPQRASSGGREGEGKSEKLRRVQEAELSEREKMAWEKFPEFNPEWPPDAQALWYENFHKMRTMDEEQE